MLLDLSLVTQTLLNVIDNYASAVTNVTVSAMPPDTLKGERTVGLYLYHIAEDATYKSLPPVSADPPQIRYTPMGLKLEYVLTGHSDLSDDTGVAIEQYLTGLAMKALHDYPVIDDHTTVNQTIVLPQALRGLGNRFRVVLQPLQHNEVTAYWTGTQALRLAAYYQVSVVLLEPESITSRAGRVLAYNVFSLARGAPHLDGSRSSVTFTIPGEPSARTVDVQPAEAPIGGQVVFFGSELAGDQTTLLLDSRHFDEPVEVGATWNVAASESQITATVQATAGANAVVPGIYSAVANVIVRRLMTGNVWRDLPTSSNRTPFVVAPLIQNISAPDPSQIVTVTGSIYQDKDIPTDAVEVFVGPQKLTFQTGATPNAGEFVVTGPLALNYRYPIQGLNSGAVLPFRLIINGAESAPNWVTVP